MINSFESQDFTMIKGDTEFVEVVLYENGEKVPFEDGDTVYFTVKETIYKKENALQKKVTEFIDGVAEFTIEPKDTWNIPYRRYVYDVQLTDKDGVVTTIIPMSNFILKGEVTRER